MSTIDQLISILDLEPLEVNLFRGRSPQTGWQRVFGGQVIGQALVAASRTVEIGAPHSLHAYFMRPGDPNIPIIYEVDRLRDGRSVATRRVTAIQHGLAIYSMMASFHTPEDSFDHQAAMPDVPGPEALSPDRFQQPDAVSAMPEEVRRSFERERALDLRPVEFERYLGKKLPDGRFNVWIRVNGRLPDDPDIHRCCLAYASDMTLLNATLTPHGRSILEKDIMAASLDHAMWFHRPFRADEWLLYSQDTPTAVGGRGLARGLIFRRDGTLVASVAQEGFVRMRKPQSDP